MFNWIKTIFQIKSRCPDVRLIDSCENPNTTYLELPDGLRLIFRDGKYDGHYVA